jgi:phosphoesterase RecJ-like protein
MSNSGRGERVGELIRQEVSKLLAKGLKDPRIGFVSVMSVKMSPDLRYADVYVSLYGDERARKSSLIALGRSAGWIRREVGKFLRLRIIPEIRFHEDTSLDEVYHLEEVFEKIHEEQEQAPMLRLDFAGLVEEFRKGDGFLICSHENPDGDAGGSMLGVAELLRALGKSRVYCALSDPVPRVCHELKGAKEVLGPDDDRPDVDTFVIVDVAQKERIGAIGKWIEPRHRVLVLDHHLAENPYGHAGVIEPSYAAVGEMVVELFNAAEIPLTKAAAECAYVAQITDTGSYQYSNTDARSHRIAAQIHDAGIDAAHIAREAFSVMTRRQFELFKIGIGRIQVSPDGLAAYSYASREDLDAHQATRQDLEGLVNYCRNIEGVQAGVFFTGVAPEMTKVSLRSSEGFHAANFARKFGGGGHAAAAGATINAPLEHAIDQVMTALHEALASEGESAS